MTERDLLKSIKNACGVSSIKFPANLNLSLNKGVLTLELIKDEILKNMQTDGAAFEGWALVLKRWLKEIKTVEVKWNKIEIDHITENEKQHFQRFLYRIKKFADNYKWFVIHDSNLSCLKNSEFNSNGLMIMNSPSKKRSRDFDEVKDLKTYTEKELEEFILTNPTARSRFKTLFNLKYIDNQLPVGIFNKEKSNKTKIFTGGKSAIDIWGISNNNEVCIFELKNAKNKKVGALSEVFFYSSIIQDAINGIIKFDSVTSGGIEQIISAKKVKCFLLAPSTHPLIDNGIFKILNESNSKIEYGNVQINNDLTFTIIKPNSI